MTPDTLAPEHTAECAVGVLPAPATELHIFTKPNGAAQVQVRVEQGTVWLTQKDMALMYGVSVANINKHLKNIYEDKELQELATINSYSIVASNGKTYETKHYNLDAIIHVGYRVRSDMGAVFRAWATARLKEYMVKGFVLDDERLKNPSGIDHFDELLARIRDIRSSEKRFYQKVRDLFAQTSVDYKGDSETAQLFFQTIQNKMLYAVAGKTAPQLIRERANAALPNMGLTTFKGDVVRVGDIEVAKNYLREEEIAPLNRLVSMFLDFAEDRANTRQQLTMQQWVEQTDSFLTFMGRDVLHGAGRHARTEANTFARGQYAIFDSARRERAKIAAEAEYVAELEATVRQVEKEGRQ